MLYDVTISGAGNAGCRLECTVVSQPKANVKFIFFVCILLRWLKLSSGTWMCNY